MRRFSQRNSLVTLADINITPLLDLAFVLLIIFVITSPLLEQGMTLKLPPGGSPDTQVTPNNVRILEISQNGQYMLERRTMTLAAAEKQLKQDFHTNPKLVVHIRGDENVALKYFVAAVDACRKNGITTFSFRTKPPGQP